MRWGGFVLMLCTSPSTGDHAELLQPRRRLICHVLPQDLNRGAQIYAGKLRDALRDDPEQEHVVVTLFAGPPGGARPDVALDVPTNASRRFLDPRAALALRRLIRYRAVDVLVAHGGEALKYVMAAAGKHPTIYYRVGLSTAEITRPARRALYRLLSRRATVVAGNSTAILDQVTSIFDVPRERQALIPNARDPQIYRPLRANEVPADPPRILFIGQLETGKRPELFLETVSQLRATGHRFDAMIIGDGPLKPLVDKRAGELSVQLLGTRQDVPELLRQSSVLVLTSAPGSEGMPGVLIEAGLSGLPVVATDAAGVSDIVRHGVTGWIVRSDTAAAMAHSVGALLNDEELRRSAGGAARAWCLQNFSTQASAALWRTLVADNLRPQLDPRNGKA